MSAATISRVDACVVAASTDAAPTSAMPIISAPAVLAVRRGLRVTLPRARRPTGRSSATNGTASPETMNRAMTGASVSMPSTTAAAPSPRNVPARSAWGRTTATSTPAMPRATSAQPATDRMRSERSWSTTSSRIASTGGTRAARRAGTSAASRLTSVPMPIDTRTVEPSSGMLPDRVMPIRSNSTRSPETSPSPPATPSAEPTMPTAAACSRIDANTCDGDAPMARSSANSRIRSRTDMVKVLAMMNAPTNSEIPAKTSRNVETNPRAFSMVDRVSARIASPVTASAFAGRAAARCSTSCVWETPSFA